MAYEGKINNLQIDEHIINLELLGLLYSSSGEEFDSELELV